MQEEPVFGSEAPMKIEAALSLPSFAGRYAPGISRAVTRVAAALAMLSVFAWCLPSASFSVEKPSPKVSQLQGGDLHALVVGVSKYRDSKIPALELADKDAKAFGEFLESQKQVFKDTHVKFLLNEQATKSSVEKFLYYALPKVGKNDTVILFFSGHGAYDPVRPQEFLFLTHDAEPEYLGATAVKMSGLEFLKGIEAERVLIVADTCYADGFSEMKPKAVASTLQSFVNEIRNSSGRAIITSSKERQLSWEVPRFKNSIFTHYLIEGLKGKADADHDGVVNLNEVYRYAYNLTKDVTGGRQHPQFEGKISGAFPLAYVGAPPPASELKRLAFQEAEAGRRDEVERLLNMAVDVNARDDANRTALFIAARRGHTDLVRLLLDRGADPDARNDSRMTALATASEQGHTEVVKLLLGSGAGVNPRDREGYTPLALASREGRLDAAKLLLARGGDIKARTETGKTPLMLAASAGHLPVIKHLVENGAAINDRDIERATAIIDAALNGHVQVVEFLVQKGAETPARGARPLDTKLVRAVVAGDVNQVRTVLNMGADANARTESGDAVPALASGLGNTKIAKALSEKGARADLKSRGGRTALLVAAAVGNVDMAKVLLSEGSRVDEVDEDGNTALLLASCYGRRDMVKALIAAESVLDQRNNRGNTPLHAASENGHTAVVRLLLSSGVDPAVANRKNETPLTAAARKGQLDAVKALCDKQIDINARTMKGDTALMIAARNGQIAVVKYLLSRGADVSAKDWEGNTAFALASEAGRKDLLELLIAAASQAAGKRGE